MAVGGADETRARTSSGMTTNVTTQSACVKISDFEDMFFDNYKTRKVVINVYRNIASRLTAESEDAKRMRLYDLNIYGAASDVCKLFVLLSVAAAFAEILWHWSK